MDLSFGVDEDSAEEEDEAAKTEGRCRYELQVDFHNVCCLVIYFCVCGACGLSQYASLSE